MACFFSCCRNRPVSSEDLTSLETDLKTEKAIFRRHFETLEVNKGSEARNPAWIVREIKFSDGQLNDIEERATDYLSKTKRFSETSFCGIPCSKKTQTMALSASELFVGVLGLSLVALNFYNSNNENNTLSIIAITCFIFQQFQSKVNDFSQHSHNKTIKTLSQCTVLSNSAESLAKRARAIPDFARAISHTPLPADLLKQPSSIEMKIAEDQEPILEEIAVEESSCCAAHPLTDEEISELNRLICQKNLIFDTTLENAGEFREPRDLLRFFEKLAKESKQIEDQAHRKLELATKLNDSCLGFSCSKSLKQILISSLDTTSWLAGVGILLLQRYSVISNSGNTVAATIALNGVSILFSKISDYWQYANGVQKTLIGRYNEVEELAKSLTIVVKGVKVLSEQQFSPKLITRRSPSPDPEGRGRYSPFLDDNKMDFSGSGSNRFSAPPIFHDTSIPPSPDMALTQLVRQSPSTLSNTLSNITLRLTPSPGPNQKQLVSGLAGSEIRPSETMELVYPISFDPQTTEVVLRMRSPALPPLSEIEPQQQLIRSPNQSEQENSVILPVRPAPGPQSFDIESQQAVLSSQNLSTKPDTFQE